jgi:hypothetical protein
LSAAQNIYITHLLAVRLAHVEERRRMAQNAIDASIANREPVTAQWGQDIQRQQEMIEAIDRSIADEQKLAIAAEVPLDTEKLAKRDMGAFIA